MPKDNYSRVRQSIIQGCFDDGVDYKKLNRDKVLEIISDSLEEAGRLFEQGVYFIPEMLSSGEAAQQVIDKTLVDDVAFSAHQHARTIVIGSVQGDQHEIGKNIVQSILKANGFQVIDLGVNVPPEKFKKALIQSGSKSLLLSCLTNLSLESVHKTVKEIRREKKLPDIQIIIGGLACSNEIVLQSGADAYFKTPKGLIAYLRNSK